MTIEEIVAAIDKKVAGSTDAQATLKLDFGSEGCVYVDGNNGTVSAEDNDADCTLSLDKNLFEDMLAGKEHGPTAFMMGKIKVDGNIGVAMQMRELFNN